MVQTADAALLILTLSLTIREKPFILSPLEAIPVLANSADRPRTIPYAIEVHHIAYDVSTVARHLNHRVRRRVLSTQFGPDRQRARLRPSKDRVSSYALKKRSVVGKESGEFLPSTFVQILTEPRERLSNALYIRQRDLHCLPNSLRT
jgi:hypothetical protein